MALRPRWPQTRRFDDLVLAMKVATPSGPLTLGRAPKSAAGPDLRQLILGSEGTLGVITELAVQFWSSLRDVYRAVSAAIRDSLSEQGTPPVILCHVSHAYPSGASLYFTVG